MKLKLSILAVVLPVLAVFAQQTQGPKLPVKVRNVTMTDLDKNPVSLKDYGKKHMMIFYVDPDARKQNERFTFDLEANKKAESPNIQGYAVLNLKDTALPNGVVRSMAEKRTAGKPSINLADANRILSTAWKLGDCNNKFCVLFVTKEGELVFFRAGEMNAQDIRDFYDTVAKYK